MVFENTNLVSDNTFNEYEYSIDNIELDFSLLKPIEENNQLLETPDQPTKQTRYYYNHHQRQLDYQKNYYTKHRDSILNNKKVRYYNQIYNQVQRTKNSISLLCNIGFRANYDLREEYYMEFHEKAVDVRFDAYNHCHGRPKNERKYGKCNSYDNRLVGFHAKNELVYNNWFERVQIEHHMEYDVKRGYLASDNYVAMREINREIRRFFGLKSGDSFVWHEKNAFNGKLESHFLNFDNSGLDMSHGIDFKYLSYQKLGEYEDAQSDLSRLFDFSVETGLCGYKLLDAFAQRFSVDGYIQVYRGNKQIIHCDTQTMLKYCQFD